MYTASGARNVETSRSTLYEDTETSVLTRIFPIPLVTYTKNVYLNYCLLVVNLLSFRKELYKNAKRLKIVETIFIVFTKKSSIR